jgi:hypothetical protein
MSLISLHEQVDLEYTRACAHQTSAREVHVSSQIICDVGVETPAINYAQFNGKPYQVFFHS